MTSFDRGTFSVAPVVETWEATVYQITGARTAFLVVPRTSALGFDQAVNDGSIDATINDYLATADTGRTLDRHSLMLALGLYDRLGNPEALAAPERDPLTGLNGQARSRDDKNSEREPTTPRSSATPPAVKSVMRWPLVVGAAVIVLLLAGIGFAVAGGGGDQVVDAAATAPPTSTAPAELTTAQLLAAGAVPPTGGWAMTFTATKIDGTLVGIAVGDKSTRTWAFTRSSCDDTGTCSATVRREYGSGAAGGAFRTTPAKAVAGKWVVTDAVKGPCFATNGQIAVADGITNTLTYSFTVTQAKEVSGKVVGSVVKGTLRNVGAPNAAGRTAQCRPGNVTYTMAGRSN